MTITIRPEHEQLIAQAVQTGAYKIPDDVISRALEVLRAEDEWTAERANLRAASALRGLLTHTTRARADPR